MEKQKILVTGAAGFIGFHLVEKLLKRDFEVIGLDNINDYYDVNLKYGRLYESGIYKEDIVEYQKIQSKRHKNYSFVKASLEDQTFIEDFFKAEHFNIVANLAAQAGVRYSIINPTAYIKSNIDGFLNVLEGCRRNNVQNFVYASSSSVYGKNTKIPFSTQDNVNHQVSLYAASKKSNELMAHTYSHLYNVPTTGLRFFTVYGPWGRPDMALFLFTKAIIENKPIDVFNEGNMYRDFTFVDDIIDGVINCIDNPASPNSDWNGDLPDPATSDVPYKIYNIGNSLPIKLIDFINAIEERLNTEAIKNFLPIQAGDVPYTYADIKDLRTDFGYNPKTNIKEGVGKFVDWYIQFYNIK